jgi:hypothetical protein
VLYGDRIVVFKEKGIELPSNFSSVGYIEFEKDKLGEKGIELFRELVSMKIADRCSAPAPAISKIAAMRGFCLQRG